MATAARLRQSAGSAPLQSALAKRSAVFLPTQCANGKCAQQQTRIIVDAAPFATSEYDLLPTAMTEHGSLLTFAMGGDTKH